ncbi:MAG TPA: hypothetical protein VKR29_05320 [Candidatus Binataceae bacterium]|nr:hypothetical protein [Candidatus Binataceae bacterium]
MCIAGDLECRIGSPKTAATALSRLVAKRSQPAAARAARTSSAVNTQLYFRPARECFDRALAAFHQCDRRDHVCARLAHRSHRLHARPAGRDRIVDHGGPETRLERAFDNLLQPVLFGFLAHEKPAHIDPPAMRRRHHRIGHRDSAGRHATDLLDARRRDKSEHQLSGEVRAAWDVECSLAVNVVV